MGSSLTKGTVRVQVRKDDASGWTTADPTLAVGEFGFETDTGKLKIGDGSTAWQSLAYLGGDTQYHYQIHQCYAGSGVTDFYLPFGASTVESSNTTDSYIDDIFWVAPFSGKLVTAYLYSDSDTGSTDMKLRVNGTLGATMLGGGVVDCNADKTVFTFNCTTANTFSAGDVINLYLDVTNRMNQATMTTKWEIT